MAASFSYAILTPIRILCPCPCSSFVQNVISSSLGGTEFYCPYIEINSCETINADVGTEQTWHGRNLAAVAAQSPPLPPVGHIWDEMLVWRKGNINKNCLCVTVLCTRYEQFLQVGQLYRALILIGLALCLPSACVFGLNGVTSFSLPFSELTLVELALDLVD